VLENRLKVLNRYMEKLDECAVALERNLRVCRTILRFYRRELLDDPKLKARNPQWIAQDHATILKTLADFEENILHSCNSTQEILQRASVVKQMGTRRENTASLGSAIFTSLCSRC
jgi:dsDNA-specific endonuclease/ATPase MutS2